MLIFFGTKTKVLSQQVIEQGTIEEAKESSLKLYSIVKYFHIFWIPIFPYSKTIKIINLKNGQEISKENMSQDLITIHNEINKKYKTPWWTFIGIAVGVMAMLCMLGIFLLSVIITLLNN